MTLWLNAGDMGVEKQILLLAFFFFLVLIWGLKNDATKSMMTQR